MLDVTDLSTLKWLIFKWYYDFMVEAVILFAFADSVYHPIPYPAETPLRSNLGHLLLEMEIKLHCFTCTMPTCLCHPRSRALPRAGFTQDTVLPWFLLFSWELLQCPLSGQEMRTPKSHLQPALPFTLLVKSLLHSGKENLQGKHRKHLKCNNLSAKYLTWLFWLEKLCCRIRAGFQLQ